MTRKPPEMFLWPVLHFLILTFAVWLVSPLIIITPDDYLSKNDYGLRLALGLLIFIIYVGKWSFDVLSPQGLARKISRIRLTALIVFIVLVISFMIYIVAQAAALYLKMGIDQDSTNSAETIITSAGSSPADGPPLRPFPRTEEDTDRDKEGESTNIQAVP